MLMCADNGNIISYDDGTHEITYVYDSANQLIRENNSRRDITYSWTYDNAGNILTYAEYAYTTESLGTAPTTESYDYGEKGQSGGWGDLLTTYDGKDFTYDTIGNLISDTKWNYNWEKGRQLASMTDGTTTWTFTYDADGMRTGRSNGTTAYTYTYNGGQLSQMTANGKNVTFSYDASGNPQTMTYDGVTYYYITNPMGDVTGIANESGTQLVFYYYTATAPPMFLTTPLTRHWAQHCPESTLCSTVAMSMTAKPACTICSPATITPN